VHIKLWLTADVCQPLPVSDHEQGQRSREHPCVLSVERSPLALNRADLSSCALPGTIVVDSVAASVYIDFLGTEAAAHRSAAKYRLLARLAPRLTRWMHARGLNQPVLLFMASALPEVSSDPLHQCL